MAGIYIHVPFCRQACRYCDFYFTVSLKYRDAYVMALLKEIEQRQFYTGTEEIETIYFGGGTPSVLSAEQIGLILEQIYSSFTVNKKAEVSLEANPDDLKEDYLKKLKRIGINRLSIGVQSFHKEDLELMRRSHTYIQAIESIQIAANSGFDNINMDLIYGVPGLTIQKWEDNLKKITGLPISHISAYHLTYETGTVFDLWKKKGKIREADDDVSIGQYRLLKEISAENGFEHYEISNLAREGFKSRHNTAYWENKKYLGLGPAAHSFNGEERSWNVKSVKKYIENTARGGGYNEMETLSLTDKFNEYLLITLRTQRGSDLAYLKNAFGEDPYLLLLDSAKPHLLSGVIYIEDEKMKIANSEWLRADMIIRDLIVV